jgi:hypothetical protein
MSHEELELPRSSRLISLAITASATKRVTSRYLPPARRGVERLAHKKSVEKGFFAFVASPTVPYVPEQCPGLTPDVDKREFAPPMKALGGSIPMAPVFVAAEQVRRLLSHKEEKTRLRQSTLFEKVSASVRN